MNGWGSDAMNLRSLTGFISLADSIDDSPIRAFADLARAAKYQFAEAGFPLQTTRIATQPISEIQPRDLVRFARDLESISETHGITFTGLGAIHADLPNASLDLIDSIPDAIASTRNVFASVLVASRANGINLKAIQSAAQIIKRLADCTAEGLGNFRFAALANCGPHIPFFPVAYQQGSTPVFAIATEGAPLAVDAFSHAQNLNQARSDLVSAIETAANTVVRVANDLAARFSFRFAGIDFSLAPYKEESHSIGRALEKLTGIPFGERGTLFAAAFVTDCLQRAKFPRAGFSGLFLPVLEDATIASHSSHYSIDSLLLYSSVCGTGLDNIPLPGDVSADALAAILLDLATLAVKLTKPLTARLVPIPHARVGDMTHFDFPWFTNARIMETRGSLSPHWTDANDWISFGVTP